MRRRIAYFIGLFVVGVIAVSCGEDARRGTAPTSPISPEARQLNAAPGTCTTLSGLVSLVNAAFGAGSPNASSALGKLDNLDKQLQKGDIAGAQDQARNLVSFILLKAQQSTLPGTHADVQALISGILCYAGLSPDAFLIFPNDPAQVLRQSNGRSGIALQANTVGEPTLITITALSETTPPLVTKLDQYPGFITISQSSPLTKPAVVGVCPASSVPVEVVGRLRLGHQAAAGFEITPTADASFLDCSTSTAQSLVSGWLQRLASLFTPKPLYAKTMFGGGVGGLITEFSPFAPVDAELRFGGGVGGTITEFQKIPSTDSARLRSPMPSLPTSPAGAAASALRTMDARAATVVNGVCAQIDAIVGTPVETGCRPTVSLRTFQGTVLQNVPVGWAIDQGGGVVAPEASGAHTCGTFAATASTATNAAGSASVCWTLGGIPGTNTTIATPAAGGDAPAGVTFAPSTITFTATALQITPIVTATGGVFVYDGQPHPGVGTCSHGLTPALTYSGGGSVPTNAGSYTLTVTCGVGNSLYVTVTGTATIQVTGAPTAAAVSCPVSLLYTGSPLTPCTGSVTGPGLNLSLLPTYSSNIVGAATASVTYAGGGNYLASAASKTFRILYVQSGCFASPIYSVMPPTKSFQSKGSNVPLKCSLRDASGAGINNAKGDVLVQDMGTNGLTTPVTVWAAANAFKATTSGNYAYGLDTSPAGFASTHYYLVTATWNDGSTSTGWFYIK